MSRTLQIQTPEIFLPFLEPSRYKAAYGGRAGMKSHTFADLLIDRCIMERGLRAVCIREIQASLEHSVKKLIQDKIRLYQLEGERADQFRILNTHIETPGDGIIIFNGMQNHTAASIKSLEGFKIAWVEEAQSLSKTSLTLLRPTIFRVPGSEIWFSWNPDQPSDPVDELFRGKDGPPSGSIVIRSNYRDNPWLTPEILADMESDRRDPDKFSHVWEGEYETHSESRVFKNWRTETFETPKDVGFLLGADWGFSVDPSTMARMFLRAPKTLLIDHERYKVGVEIDHMPAFFDGLVCGCNYLTPHPCRKPEEHGMARRVASIADSARPETISYMRRNGYPLMEPAIKGANSVKEGVIFLQGYDIVLHSRCIETEKEFRSYSYVVDKLSGVVTGVLEDKKNHVIDPVRYATERLRSPRTVKAREVSYG